MASFRTASGIIIGGSVKLIALPVQRVKIRQTLIANVVAKPFLFGLLTHRVQVADDTLPARRTAPPGTTHIHRLLPSVCYLPACAGCAGSIEADPGLVEDFSGPWGVTIHDHARPDRDRFQEPRTVTCAEEQPEAPFGLAGPGRRPGCIRSRRPPGPPRTLVGSAERPGLP